MDVISVFRILRGGTRIALVIYGARSKRRKQ